MIPTQTMESLHPKLLNAVASLDALFQNPEFVPSTCLRTLRVGAIDYAMYEILTPAILAIRETAPGIRFEVRPHDRRMIDFLANGLLDLVISPETEVHDKNVLTHKLFESRHVYLVRNEHPLARRYRAGESITREDIAEYETIGINTVLDDARSVDRVVSESPARSVAVSLPYMLCTPTLLTQSDLVQAVPGKLAADFVRLYPLTALPCDASGTNFNRMLYWHRRTDKDPALQWVRGMILRYGTVSTDESAVEALFRKDCPTTK